MEYVEKQACFCVKVSTITRAYEALHEQHLL